MVIMDYAQAFTVMAQNPVAQGICLTNMGILRFRNQDFGQAAKDFAQAAKLAAQLSMRAKNDKDDQAYSHNRYLFCK